MSLPINKIICGDCLEIMKDWPDNCVDLVLTDPPYGIDYGGQLKGKGNGKGGIDRNGWRSWDCPEWDKERPRYDDFLQVLRIGKNQIIWGGNYFADYLPASQGWLVWNKGQRNFSLADGELAWTSFDKALRIFGYSRGEALAQETRMHPTQKPLKLGLWVLEKHSKPGDLICDCYCGSGSFCVAAKMLGRNYIGIDISPEYCKIAEERLKDIDTGVPVKEARKGQMSLLDNQSAISNNQLKGAKDG